MILRSKLETVNNDSPWVILMFRLDVQTARQTELLPLTDRVEEVVTRSGIANGICHLYVPHTTAAVTINEGADPMVAYDILLAVDPLIPLHDPGYRHLEGNSAAHIKACFFGASETIFIQDSRLQLGRWQAIFFCEFDGPRRRQVNVKIVKG